MARIQTSDGRSVESGRYPRTDATKREHQAYSLLYLGFIAAPLIAGLDKFFHYLVDWNIYVSPMFAGLAGGRVTLMMQGAGVVEIAAGILVAIKPSAGGVVVAAWLWGIIANLLLIPGYYDIALRDFGLSLGALALSRLASDYGR
jgi:hypothetical protein